MSWFGRAAHLRKDFSPSEARDPHTGKWIGGEAISGHHDTLEDRYDLSRKLADPNVSTGELFNHPSLARSVAVMKSIEPTSNRKDYGTSAYEDAREFTIHGEKVTGYKNAVPKIIAAAKAYAPGGIVKNDKQAYIVIGPPAAGKSTLAERIAHRESAAIIDSDDVKKMLPEFEGGIGANAVHEESARIVEGPVSEELLGEGSNVVIPKVGDNVRSIDKKINGLKALGYDVHLVNMDVTPDTAARRMLSRFVHTGRLIAPSYFASIGTKPKETFDKLKKDNRVTSYAEIDNNPPLGAPQRTEGTGQALAATRA